MGITRVDDLAELEAAVRAGATLNVESEGEATRALAIGDRLEAEIAERRAADAAYR